MWTRPCAHCHHGLQKRLLSLDVVCAFCGWIWRGTSNEELANSPLVPALAA